ncbi:MAG: hypothetical protein IJA42_03675 [Bacteroidales bacterium]|nr:hypothetical protein [Bacteroidales bacterium]
MIPNSLKGLYRYSVWQGHTKLIPNSLKGLYRYSVWQGHTNWKCERRAAL